MNIDNFIFTVSISLAIGLLAGFFLRDFIHFLFRFYKRYIRKPKYLQRVTFKDSDISPEKTSHKKNNLT